MGMGMKSLKWEGIGTKNLFPHTSSVNGPLCFCASVFSQGDDGKSWYIIMKGSVNVVIYGKVAQDILTFLLSMSVIIYHELVTGH